MDSSDLSKLTYEWSGPALPPRGGRVRVQDETLREGLQSPTVHDPPEEAKLRLLHLMVRLGIDSASLGIPAAGPRQAAAAVRLCREIADARLALQANLGGRTVVDDVRAIVEVRERTGLPVEACLFIGSSPIRQLVEGWSLDGMLARTRESVAFAVGEGLPVTFITEDTTRSTPEQLRALFTAALDAGATRLCLCDTVGAAIPVAAANLVRWVRELLREQGVTAGIDWHGHNDRGLGVANALAAIEAGADRVHATALGLGERTGNTEMEVLLPNLRLLGLRECDLSALPEYASVVSSATGVPIPARAPMVGRDAFRTGTGVHAAAIVKARQRGADALADRIYSSVPAAWLGRRQEIVVGPLSGASNVRDFLLAHGLPADDERVRAVLSRAKAAERVLEERELLAFLEP